MAEKTEFDSIEGVFPVQLHWGDCDPAGIIFYPTYFRWFDAATWALSASVGYSAKRMREAYELFSRQNPEIEADGEMHGDAALSEVVRRGMLMDSRLTGEANILVCPNIDAANILFNVLKAVSGEGTTVGPILMGAAKPAHVLTPSSTYRRVLNMTALAAAQAGIPAVVKKAVGA